MGLANWPIIREIAWLLGMLMDTTFNVLSNTFGIESIGLSIIVFTVIIFILMFPLTLRQQKFSKMSAVMNPEIQAVQKKYKGKRDQASVLKMQEETKQVYEKYGTSPINGCMGMFIQLPIMFGLFAVINRMPAHVNAIRNAYMPLVDAIMNTDGFQPIMENIGEGRPISINPERFDYSEANTIVDVLYQFRTGTWETLGEYFSELQPLINETVANVSHFNSFLGISIAEPPSAVFMEAIRSGAIFTVILAVAIPLLSGLTQWISLRLTPQPAMDSDNPMASSMKMMSTTMPIFSVVMCFTLPAGLGVYWITSAVVRSIQQFSINKYFNKITLEKMIEQNVEKAAKKRERRGTSRASSLSQMAQKNIEQSKKMPTVEANEALDAVEHVGPLKEGSMASKANLVRNFNQNKDK